MQNLIPPPVVVILFGLAMWRVHIALGFLAFDFAWQKALALVLLAVGLTLMMLAAMTFFAAKTTINPLRPARASTLVTTGVFSLSRNPIYLGDFLVLLALVVWFGNVINLVLLPLFVWFINRFQIAPEERALTALFGDDYLRYCKNVRRWL